MNTLATTIMQLLSNWWILGSHPYREKEGRKEMFSLTTNSAHFNYSYMALNIRTTQREREIEGGGGGVPRPPLHV